MKLSKGKIGAVLAAALVVGGPVAAVSIIPAAAAAQSAAAKATVDAAKARGDVGEQADGYLGLVKGSADAATTAAVAEINAGRTAAYREAAAKTQVNVDAAAGATAAQLIARVPAGQFYKDASGKWVKK